MKCGLLWPQDDRELLEDDDENSLSKIKDDDNRKKKEEILETNLQIHVLCLSLGCGPHNLAGHGLRLRRSLVEGSVVGRSPPLSAPSPRPCTLYLWKVEGEGKERRRRRRKIGSDPVSSCPSCTGAKLSISKSWWIIFFPNCFCPRETYLDFLWCFPVFSEDFSLLGPREPPGLLAPSRLKSRSFPAILLRLSISSLRSMTSPLNFLLGSCRKRKAFIYHFPRRLSDNMRQMFVIHSHDHPYSF